MNIRKSEAEEQTISRAVRDELNKKMTMFNSLFGATLHPPGEWQTAMIYDAEILSSPDV